MSSPNPFKDQHPPRQGFMSRLLGRPHGQGLVSALESLLASKSDWWNLTASEVQSLEAQHKVKFRQVKKQAFAVLQTAAKGDTHQAWARGGPERLTRLAAVMGLEDMAAPVIAGRSAEVIQRAIEVALSDDTYTEAEERNLEALADVMSFPRTEVAALVKSAVTARVQSEVTHALADGKMSPDEEARIETLSKNLRAKVNYDPKSAEMLTLAKDLWRIDEGPLPPINCPINLQRGEIPFFVGTGEVLEERSRSVGRSYGGLSLRVKLVPGVYYNVGSLKGSSQRESFTHSYGRGDIVLTNKRILFNGGTKNLAIRLSNVVDYEPFSDGVEVRRSSGKPLTFVLASKDETFHRYFARALREG